MPNASALPWRPGALLEALPGLAAIVVFVAWSREAGGYFPTAWYAGGILFASMLVVLLLAWPGLLSGIGRAIPVALGAFGGFAVWSAASMGWADVRGDAWDGANRVTLYVIVFALFALWRWTPQAKAVILGGFVLSTATLGLLTLLAASRALDPAPYFDAGRFSEPIGYSNGNAGLFLLAFWPALALAARGEVPWLLRPVLLGAAGILLELAVLPQSRSTVLVFPLGVAVFFLLVPGRLRAAAFALPVCLTLVAAFPRLLDSGAGTGGAALGRGADLAAETVLLSGLALLVAGAVLVAVDHRVRISERLRRRAERALAVSTALAVAVGVIVAVTTLQPIARAESAWAEFSGDSTSEPLGEARLLQGFDTNRLDFWRVALDQFQAHPIGGIGSENFGVAYVRDRRSGEETLYPHSLVLEVLAQTGIVGSILFVVFLAAALTAALVARRRQQGLERTVTGIGIVMFAAWFAHASVDWLWELPALTAPALAFLALAGSPPRLGRAGASSRGHRVLTFLVAASTVGAFVSFVFPWLAAREARFAASVWRADPAAATAAVGRARSLNPLTDRADLVAGSIARRREDWGAMAQAYERALARNPHSWYSHLQLALARAQAGNRAAALAEVGIAKSLNPSEPLVDIVAQKLERGADVNVAGVTAILRKRHASVTGPEQEPDPTR